jgi:hypothetical protein
LNIYLYIKQCTHCGLKYFGRTINSDPIKYLGSGVHWTCHIKQHGKDKIITDWVKAFNNQEECTKFALEFSNQNNIVESREWANLCIEDGAHSNGVFGITHSEETKQKLSEAAKKQMQNPKMKAAIIKGNKNRKYNKDWYIKRSLKQKLIFDNLSINKQNNFKYARKGTHISKEHSDKIKESNKIHKTGNIWVHNKQLMKNRLVKPNQIPDDYELGRL